MLVNATADTSQSHQAVAPYLNALHSLIQLSFQLRVADSFDLLPHQLSLRQGLAAFDKRGLHLLHVSRTGPVVSGFAAV